MRDVLRRLPAEPINVLVGRLTLKYMTSIRGDETVDFS